MGMPAKRPKQPAKVTRELEASPRPFRNHYSGGMKIGACSTWQGAAIAAYAHIVRGEATQAQVVAPNGEDAWRGHWTSFGVSTWFGAAYRPQGAPAAPKADRQTLRRVK